MNAAADQSPDLSLFHADALVLVGAVALIFLLVGIAAFLSLRARTRFGAIAGLLCALLLMALLPFWVSLLTLVLVSEPNLSAASSWYLWLTLFDVIHLERVFAAGTLVSGIVYFAFPGTPRARMLRTLACLALLVGIAIIYTVIQLRGYQLIG
jgi:hypothetical protein